jgi:hypothetical protein
MASTWGGTAIPAPSRYERNPEVVGGQYIMADGSMVTDSITTKYRISMTWENITYGERDTLLGKLATFTSAALVIGSETSENVIPVVNSVVVSRLAGGTRAYTLSCEVRTA